MQDSQITPTVEGASSLQRFVGRHSTATLILGDSETMELPTADALVSDPPYGIGYSHGGDSGVLARTTKFVGRKVMGDDKPFEPARWLQYPIVVLDEEGDEAKGIPLQPVDERGIGEDAEEILITPVAGEGVAL